MICESTPPRYICSHSWTQKLGRLWCHTCLVYQTYTLWKQASPSTQSCPHLLKFVFLKHKPLGICLQGNLGQVSPYVIFPHSRLVSLHCQQNVYKFRNMLKMAEGYFFYHNMEYRKRVWWTSNAFLVTCLVLSQIIIRNMSTFHLLWHLCNCSLESVETVQLYWDTDVRTSLFLL